MAVFEKKIPRKVYLDDTQVLTCKFENTQNIQGHTEYIIRVQRGPLAENSWHIYKRYNDFLSLNIVLQVSGVILPLPPKKLIGNMEREFIAERQVALQNYLNVVLMNPILASSLPVRKFLDPENYSTPFQELALQHVSMALRSEVNYEIVKPVPEVGWRLRKHYFQVKSRNSPKEYFLSWVEHGPDKYLDDRELQAAFKSIGSIQHPNIHPIEFVSCNEVGGFVIRALSPAGSLRDLLCGAKPKTQFIKKYGNPKQVKPLSLSDIAYYGKQILDALKFLHDKGLPFGHLQTGNIVLEDGKAKLLDIENGILGLPSYYRPFFVQHKKIQSLETIDVYCFGHVVYEMAFGHPLHESVCDILPDSCPPLLRSVLESVLSPDACKLGLPSLGTLIAHPFFCSAQPISHHLQSSERPHLKFNTHMKEALKMAWTKTETRLKEEQKVVRHQKRLAKVQELLSSEEDKRKKKQKHRQQDTVNFQQPLLHLPPETNQQLHQPKHPQLFANGKSPERSDSPNSTSTATSAGTVTPPSGFIESSTSHLPPPLPPPAPPPGLVNLPPTTPTDGGGGVPARSALLSSICNFNKAALRQTAAKDPSAATMPRATCP